MEVTDRDDENEKLPTDKLVGLTTDGAVVMTSDIEEA